MFGRNLSGKLLTLVWLICFSLFAAIPAYATAWTYPSDTTSLVTGDTLQKTDTVSRADSAKKSPPLTLEHELVRHADDSIVQDLAHKKVYLWGNAEVTYGDIDLKAAYIAVNFNNNTIFARGVKDSTGKIVGMPVFKQGNETFQAKEITYNFVTRKGIVHDVRTKQSQGFLYSNLVKRMPNSSFNIKSGYFTTCDRQPPDYEFKFGKARVIPNKLIVTGPIYMELEGVPLPLALPFGIFPNNPKRKSGLIVPTYGESANRGFYLEGGGFFWYINDYVTLKITGDIYTGGSWRVAPVFNYRKRYKYSGSLSLSLGRNIINHKGDPDYHNTRDFRIGWTFSQDPTTHPSSHFSANVNIITSNFVKYNAVKPQTYLSNEFQSSIAYQKSWAGKYFLTLSASHRQNTKTHDVNVTLPELSFTVNRFYPFRRKNSISNNPLSNLSISYTMSAQNTINTKDSLLFSPNTFAHHMQNGIKQNIPVNIPFKLFKHFNLNVSLNMTDRIYFQSLRRYWVNDTSAAGGHTKTDTIPGFNNVFNYGLNASLTTKIYGLIHFKKGFLRAVRHVMTPSVGFSYVPDFGNEKWGYVGHYYNRLGERITYSKYENFLYGAPETQKVGNINFNIANSLEIKVRSKKDTVTGLKKIPLIQNFTISGNYDFAKDSVRMSHIYLSGRTTLWKGLTIHYSSSLDPYVTDSAGNDINKTLWQVNRRLFRMNNTAWNVSFNLSLSDKDFKKGKKKTEQEKTQREKALKKLPPQEANAIINHPNNYIDWGVSWSLNLNYNFTYTNVKNYVRQIWTPKKTLVQTLGVQGQVNITPNWKFTFQTGWDFTNNELSYTSISLYRNLHCWQMSFNWIPIGPRKSWNFTINVKAQFLKDLRLTKRKDFRDYY